jgi:hypothetical protein
MCEWNFIKFNIVTSNKILIQNYEPDSYCTIPLLERHILFKSLDRKNLKKINFLNSSWLLDASCFSVLVGLKAKTIKRLS